MSTTKLPFRNSSLQMILLWSTIYLLIFLYNRLAGTGDLNRTIGWGWDNSLALSFGWVWVLIILLAYFFIERSESTLSSWPTKIHAFLMGLATFSYLPFVFEQQPFIHHMIVLLICLVFVVNIIMSLVAGRSARESHS